MNNELNFQRTLQKNVCFSGVGLHSGQIVHVEIRPTIANTGILFRRIDLPNSPYIKAIPENVIDTTLATRIGVAGAEISTIEHLMAAFFIFGIDNVIVDIDSFEIPILDGSAAPFLALFNEAGIQMLKVPKNILVIKKPVEIIDIKNPSKFIRIEPSYKPQISYLIDFANIKTIGTQLLSINIDSNSITKEVSFARTFGLLSDVQYLQQKGLARGANVSNAIALDIKSGVLNVNGLRISDEFVRHKILDCIGDLYLLGMPILGHIIASKAGHDLHTSIAKKIVMNIAEHQLVTAKSTDKELFKIHSLIPKFSSRLDLNNIYTFMAING